VTIPSVTRTITVGKVTITAASDGDAEFPMRLDQLYPGVTAEDWRPFRERYPDAFAGEGVRFQFNSYLVRSPGAMLLVDTGIGESPNPILGSAGGLLMGGLASAGVRPGEIDTVFMTHLHLDHIGWNVDGAGRPRFPNARYVVHRADWEEFTSPQVLANPVFGPAIKASVEPLKAQGVLDLLEGDHAPGPEVTALCTPGHTLGHMSLLIASGGEKALITGDVVGNPAQITNPDWSEPFDSDEALAVRTRTALLERIEAEGMKAVAAGHFPGGGFGSIVRLEGRRYWQAL